MRRPRSRGDAGSAAAELALMTPLLMLLLVFVVALGRLVDARLEVQSAARQAARAASIARDSGVAAARARSVATSALAGRGAVCQTLQVRVAAGGLRPGGRVTVRVTCGVALSDLVLLRLPGTRTVSSSFTSPVDVYRSGNGRGVR